MKQFYRKHDFSYLIIIISIPVGISISSVLTLVPTMCIFWKLFEFIKDYDNVMQQLRQISKEEDSITEIISEIDLGGKVMTVTKTETGSYDIIHGDQIVQPNHDADDIIRYLSMIIHNLDYIDQKDKK